MSKRRMVPLRIAGSVVGLLVVGVTVGVALFSCLHWASPTHDHAQGEIPMVAISGLGGVVAGTVGAALGATVTQKLLGQRSSFWKALLGAFIGMILVGIPLMVSFFGAPFAVVPIAAGAVIGSGWKAKPRDAASPSG